MRRLCLALLVTCVSGLFVAFAGAALPGPSPRWASAIMALATGGCLAALIGVALGERAREPRLAATLGFIGLGVGAGLAALLVLPGVREGDPGPLVLGLPLGAAWMLYGVGLLPMLVVPVVYAWTFDAVTLSEADLEHIRALRPAANDAASPSARARPDA